jgi:hypothetical protein
MPKKKLTKAQVKANLKRIKAAFAKLMIDRVEYGTTSHVPMTAIKILEIDNKIPFAVKVK